MARAHDLNFPDRPTRPGIRHEWSRIALTQGGRSLGVEIYLAINAMDPPRDRTYPLVDLTGQIALTKQYPSAHGGYSDVWAAYWRNESDEHKVAVKVLRVIHDDDQSIKKMNKRLQREIRIWQKLKHEHVLKLLGTTSDFGAYISMVCPWQENGNLNNYLVNHESSLSNVDRLRILCEIAAGLSYLHSASVIHGDLTGSNVLMNNEGKACLSDFGLSTIAAEFHSNTFMTSSIGGNVRWAAPELYRIYDNGHVPTISKNTDIYSFGSVMLQVLSGKVPYHYLKTDGHVIITLNGGNKPQRPSEPWILEEYWDLISLCWIDPPDKRPRINIVLENVQCFYYSVPKVSTTMPADASLEDTLEGQASLPISHARNDTRGLTSIPPLTLTPPAPTPPLPHPSGSTLTPSFIPHRAKRPSTEVQRHPKPKRLKARSITNNSASISIVPRDAEGAPVLPMNVGIFIVHNLGRVCGRKGFHTGKYIFPIGYEVSRRYLSMLNPNTEGLYTCKIIDGDAGPKFLIIPTNEPYSPVVANTPAEACSHIFKQIDAFRNITTAVHLSGPEFFGLEKNMIRHLIEELPDADRLEDYVWENYVESETACSQPSSPVETQQLFPFLCDDSRLSRRPRTPTQLLYPDSATYLGIPLEFPTPPVTTPRRTPQSPQMYSPIDPLPVDSIPDEGVTLSPLLTPSEFPPLNRPPEYNW